MVGQVCSVGPGGVSAVGSGGLLVKLELGDLDLIFRGGRLC